jgi:hypothetical protein
MINGYYYVGIVARFSAGPAEPAETVLASSGNVLRTGKPIQVATCPPLLHWLSLCLPNLIGPSADDFMAWAPSVPSFANPTHTLFRFLDRPGSRNIVPTPTMPVYAAAQASRQLKFIARRMPSSTSNKQKVPSVCCTKIVLVFGGSRNSVGAIYWMAAQLLSSDL